MAANKSVTDIVNIAKPCLWLNYRDLNRQSLFSPSGTFRPQDLNLLKFVTRRVDWMNTKSPSYPTLRKTANYLYSLCGGKNAAIAEGILDQQGGNVVYNPITGQVLNGIVLTPDLATTPYITADANFLNNAYYLDTMIQEATNAITYGSNVQTSQACLDKAKQLIDNANFNF